MLAKSGRGTGEDADDSRRPLETPYHPRQTRRPSLGQRPKRRHSGGHACAKIMCQGSGLRVSLMKFLITVLLAALLVAPLKGTSASTQTRDNWRSVSTNNLFLLGNADPEKLRQVAAWLEFFHSAFARLVSRNVLDSSVATRVVV